MISLEALRIWNIKRGFSSLRPAFYRDLGSALEAQTSLRELIGRLARANAGPLSQMMGLWKQALTRNPESLARATRELVVPTDTVVMRAAEASNAPGQLYLTYANNLMLRDRMIKTIKTPLITPLFSVVALIAAYGFFKFKVYDKLGKDIKQEYWTSSTKFAYQAVSFVWSVDGLITLGLITAGIVWIGWSMNNFAHPIRRKLDRFGFYGIFAQMEMLSVLSVMAALIRAGRSDVESVALIQSNSSPWMRSVLQRVKTYTNQKGTPVLSSLVAADIPISPVLAARIESLSSETKPSEMPDLIITACSDEAIALCDRMTAFSEVINAVVKMVLMVAIGIVMAGIFGLQDSAREMGAAMQNHQTH